MSTSDDKSLLLDDNIRHWFIKYPKAMRDVYCCASVPDGWISLVEPLVAMCDAAGVEVHQLKSKFFGLRMYVGPSTVELNRAIHDAETNSFTICTVCGRTGVKTRRGVLCAEHKPGRFP